MELQFYRQKWQKLLIPEFTISAISIEERMVKVFCFDKAINRITKVGKYALPAGIIEEGILKKPQELQSFFLSLKQKIWPKEKNVWVVLSLPSANFYTNLLSLPDLEEERFKEAVVFNTQMISPLPLEEVYFDWEDWGASVKDNEREVFVALGIKKQINPFLELLGQAGFQIVAIEPWALSLVRFFQYFGEKQQSILSISLRTEGIEFILSEDNKLIFFDFDSWSEIFGAKIPRQITLEMLKKHFDGEIPMLLNFYFLKRKKPLQKFVFISSQPQQNMARGIAPGQASAGSDNYQIAGILGKWLNETYKLAPLNINLPPYMRWVSREWFAVIGTALRGLIPRHQDAIVSLSPVGTEDSYEQNHLYRVTSVWTKAVLAVIVSFTLTFGILNATFFVSAKNRYQAAVAKPLDTATVDKETGLLKAADEFNALVGILEKAQVYKKDWKTTFNNIFDSGGQKGIIIQRILISNAPANNITMSGQAVKKDAVISWKQDLETSGLLKDINLPLEAMVETAAGVSFSLNAKIQNDTCY